MNKIKNPIATITMQDGKVIQVELYYDKAPNTVVNFVTLAQAGFYDGLKWHRIIDGFMIQGGDPQGNGTGGPGYTIQGEFPANGHTQNDISHLPGVISMARQGSQTNDSAFYNTAGSQFFICVADASFLDGKYAAFGKTTDEQSLQNVIALGKVETDYSDAPVNAQIIASVTVDTHGQTLPELVKVQ